MPVEKITADEFATNLNTGIQDINPGHDTEIGPIPDLIVNPSANVLENQNDRIRRVSQLILLNESETFEDEDVEDFVFNEDLIRSEGGRSSGTVIFSRATAPAADITVQQNYPIGSDPDEETGDTTVFVTTETKTLPAATAASFFNVATERYELEVTVQAVLPGKSGEVAPNRVNRPLRPLAGFDSVFNRNRTSVVTDRETNSNLIERYKISIPGTQLATRTGLELFIRSNFSDAGDVLVVNAGDPLITRTGQNGSAVDTFITGQQSISRIDSKEFLGLKKLIVLDNKPVLQIVSVPGFLLGTDFIFVKDASGVSKSTRSVDGIEFIPGGSAPAVGSAITINYEQDVLIANIQSSLDDADNDVGGQDALIRGATQVDTALAAQLTVVSGFSFSTVRIAVEAKIIAFINALGLGQDVEESDLQGQVRTVSGVDNFIFTLLDKVGGSGNADIPIVQNEFAQIESANISITP